jgi:uncharacterized protein (DUF362 family)
MPVIIAAEKITALALIMTHLLNINKETYPMRLRSIARACSSKSREISIRNWRMSQKDNFWLETT